MTVVRRCEPEDVDDALFLARMMHAESPLHNSYRFDDAKVRQLIINSIADPNWLPVLAYAQGKPIGMALMLVTEMFYGPDKECLDLVFYVDPTARGGHAAFKMSSMIQWWASDQGAERCTIGIHNGINHDTAMSFFMKMGFKPLGVLMEKSVH